MKDRISAAELSYFCSQIALMMDAGLTLYDGMETLAESARDSEESQMYRALAQCLGQQGSLCAALRENGRFPAYLVEMAGVGEETGTLEAVMHRLSAYYEREARMRAAALHAVTYPLVLGGMMALIMLIILWKVMPVFRRVLVSIGAGLGGMAGQMMNWGAAIGWVVLALLALALIGAGAVLLSLRTGKREKVLSSLMNIFPWARRVNALLSAARLSDVLGLAINSGFPVERALEMAPLVLGDGDASQRVRVMREKLDEGTSFLDALEESALFDPMQNRMLRLGLSAGYEGKVLDKLSQTNEEAAENSIDRLISIIEPVLVAALSVVVGAILLSVMLPMLGILRTIV